jgi:hypothetical protein
MPWIIAGGALLGGALGMAGSNSAAKKQAEAARNAMNQSQAAGDRANTLGLPWYNAGSEGIGTLANLLGIRQDPAKAAVPTTYMAGQSGDPLWEKLLGEFQARHTAQFGQAMNRPWTADGDAQREYNNLANKYRALKAQEPQQEQAGNFGSLLNPFTADDLESEPGYEFGRSQGELALQRGASAAGMRFSPATQKALLRFNQDYAGTKYDAAFNRDAATKDRTFNYLAGISGVGQNQANQIGANTMNAAGQSANYLTQAGNAAAAGRVGTTNAMIGGINNGLNMWSQQRMLDQYLSGGNNVAGDAYQPSRQYYGQ